MTTQQKIDQINEKEASLQAEVAALKAPQNVAVEPEKPRVDGFWQTSGVFYKGKSRPNELPWIIDELNEFGPVRQVAEQFDSTGGCHGDDGSVAYWHYDHRALESAGNSFPSEEAAEMALLRRQSMRIDWVPKRGDEYHIWQKDGSSMIYKWGSDVEFDKMALALGRVHRTSEQDESHYDTYHKAWEYLEKGGN